MTLVIWSSTIVSFAACVFIAIAGSGTRPKYLYTPLIYAFFIGVVVSLLGLLGSIQLRNTPATYMFSLFGLPVHEGFRVTMVTASANLLLYLVAVVYLWRPWRSLQSWNPWDPPLWKYGVYNESDSFMNADAYSNTFYVSWLTFTVSLVILGPTLAQTAFALYIGVIGTIAFMHKAVRRESRLPLFDVLLLYAVFGVAFLAESAPTWMSWVHLHTVELTRIDHSGSNGHAWHGPTMTEWLSVLGFIGQSGGIVLMAWMSGSHEARRAVARMSFMFLLVSIAYLIVARPVLLAGMWGIIVYVVDLALAISSTVIAVKHYRPPFTSKLMWTSQEVTHDRNVDSVHKY